MPDEDAVDMTDQLIPVVPYGVKSSEDENESVADQQRLILEAIEKEGGRRVVGVFGEANASGYRKERGPQLEAAMRTAIEAAAEHGQAELWVWISSRLARGDGLKGRRSIGKIVNDLRYENVTVRSVTDDAMVTPMLAGIAGEVSHKYSADLSAHMKRAVEKRRREGKPIGVTPFGYALQRQAGADGTMLLDGHGRVVSARVIDPVTGGPAVLEMFQKSDAGATPGDIASALNKRGVRTVQGNLWDRRSVIAVLRNSAYKGEKGYEAIVPAELWERVNEQMQRTDPAATQRRRGGRPPSADFLLRTIVFCGECGAPLNTTTNGRGQRYYACRSRHTGTGACSARVIPAELAETHVLNHLHSFVRSAEDWLREQAAKRDEGLAAREAALKVERSTLDDLDKRRARHFAEYRRLVDNGDPLARYALEAIAQIDGDRESQQQRIAEAEAVVAELTGPPDIDAALDYYSQIVDVVEGRIRHAHGARELNAALASVVAGMWMQIKRDGRPITWPLHPFAGGKLRKSTKPPPEPPFERLLVEFALRAPRPAVLPGSVPIMPELRPVRESLPPVVKGAYQPLEPPGNRTGPGLPAGPGAKLSDKPRIGACADPDTNLDIHMVGLRAMDALTINEAAQTSGWSPRMLRYIEGAGLLELPRSAGGYRLYGPAQLQRLRTLRELLARFDFGLAELGFARRLRSDERLRRAVDEWFETEPARPEHVAADDWLRWEQEKHQALIAAATNTHDLLEAA